MYFLYVITSYRHQLSITVDYYSKALLFNLTEYQILLSAIKLPYLAYGLRLCSFGWLNALKPFYIIMKLISQVLMTEMGGTTYHYLSPGKNFWRNKQQQRIQHDYQQQCVTKGFT